MDSFISKYILAGFGLRLEDKKKLIRQGWLLVMSIESHNRLETSRGEAYDYKSKAEMYRRAKAHEEKPRTLVSHRGGIHGSELEKLINDGYTIIKLADQDRIIKAIQRGNTEWVNMYKKKSNKDQSVLDRFEQLSSEEFIIVHK